MSFNEFIEKQIRPWQILIAFMVGLVALSLYIFESVRDGWLFLSESWPTLITILLAFLLTIVIAKRMVKDVVDKVLEAINRTVAPGYFVRIELNDLVAHEQKAKAIYVVTRKICI